LGADIKSGQCQDDLPQKNAHQEDRAGINLGRVPASGWHS
jgi:hypothetical protein